MIKALDLVRTYAVYAFVIYLIYRNPRALDRLSDDVQALTEAIQGAIQ